MNLNFSRQLAIFHFAQEIVHELTALDVGVFITSEQINRAAERYLGKPLTGDEFASVLSSLTEAMPIIDRDCGVFYLAHQLYHAIED